MQTTPYKLTRPKVATSCAIFNSPHSGAIYPAGFVADSCLSLARLRSSEDAYVDRLIASAPQHGAPLLAAQFPRAYVDANRAVDELDPGLIRRAPPQKTNPRVMAGLGVIPRVVANGWAIRTGKISMNAAQARLDECYHPYHTALADLIAEQKARFGMCLLFDFHSMPRNSISAAPKGFGHQPEIVLGDRYRVSCDSWVVDAASDFFSDAGFRVARNAPFAGGYITSNYGKPPTGVHALQIEIDRSLYMDEEKIIGHEGFVAFCRRIDGIVARLSTLGPDALAVAAE